MIGQIISQYRVVKKLGDGAQGGTLLIVSLRKSLHCYTFRDRLTSVRSARAVMILLSMRIIHRRFKVPLTQPLPTCIPHHVGAEDKLNDAAPNIFPPISQAYEVEK